MEASEISQTAAASTMLRITNFLMALSLGTHLAQLVQRTALTCPLLCLQRPPPVFVGGQIRTMEITQNVTILYIFSDETEFTERTFGIVVLLQITQSNFEHTALQVVRGDFLTLGTVNQGFANLASGKHVRGFNIIPIFTGEGINNLLFATFFASFGETLIFTDRHL